MATFSGNGELLPLDSEEGQYFIFNVTRVVDPLKESNSKNSQIPKRSESYDHRTL